MEQALPMNGKVSGPQGPLQGDAARGFDVAYQEQRRAAEQELDGTLVGPDSMKPAVPSQGRDIAPGRSKP